jgi:peptidoglycan/xylan/chitin deacetylase (PgdA/CDA1 family)
MHAPIPILLYHRIDDAGLSTSITPDAFRQHLELLAQSGWRSLSADEFTYHLRTGRALPPRCFLITFDDGYETVYSAALGILREFDFKAICFIATRLMRGSQVDDAAHEVEEPEKFMHWDQVRMLQASGVVDCQSHSHTHGNFSGVEMRQLREDLALSVEMLSSELRMPVRHFSHLAWPWGLAIPAWRDIAREVGLSYQYSVSRQAFRLEMAHDDIPRTCFDAVPFSSFQRQFWLQTGSFAPLWDIAYPLGRKLRHFSRRLTTPA